ncbi:MAG: ATP-grasp domain-containing protein [Alphaproteobacteria bacterium]|nr:ATP-grasp domain-containing protein [Alphaproteobacteria bacterium]
MSDKPLIVLVGAKETIVRIVKSVGVEVLLIDLPTEIDPAAIRLADKALAIDIVSIKFDDLFKMIASVSPRKPAGFIAVSDPWLLIVSHLNKAFGCLGASPETTLAMLNKDLMRKILDEIGIPSVPWQHVQKESDLVGFMTKYPGPIIIKPVDGRGSRNIYKVNSNIEAAKELWAKLVKLEETGWLAEVFLEGPEFSVETVTENGRHYVITVTDKHKNNNFVEIGHRIPSQLAEDLKKQIAESACAVLTSLKLNFGPAHTEVILTKQGPRVVETHNRVGGDRIGRLCEMVYGCHPIAWMAAKLANISPPKIYEKPDGGATIAFFTPTPGKVKLISGLEETKNIEGVEEIILSVKKGSVVKEVLSSNDRSGHVIAKGNNTQVSDAICSKAIKNIQIITE